MGRVYTGQPIALRTRIQFVPDARRGQSRPKETVAFEHCNMEELQAKLAAVSLHTAAVWRAKLNPKRGA